MSDLQIRNETNELRLLFEVTRALEGASELSDQLDTSLELMARYTGMMRGTLLLVDPASRDIVLEAAYGLSAAQQKRARYKLGEGITGKVIETAKPMVAPRISQEPLFLNRTGARDMQKEEISFLCVPVLVDGLAVGALSADRLFADSVSLEEDMRLLQVLASLVGRAVRTRSEFKALHSAVVEENRRLQQLLHGAFDSGKIIGSSAAMRAVLEEVTQVTGTNATVLIRGESGTGKELVAGVIHSNSNRAGRPFVKVNCAALPEGLVESELFGHERGAFTGATGARKGRFEMAHGGTLFLDEVGDMTPLTQAKLLRAIQEKEFERVGGAQTIRVDVRLVAATNRDLERMVKEGQFREDLYYRLSVFPIILPPLRERREDVMALVSHFLDKSCAASKRKVVRISSRAAALLMAYDWPGNIRELENVVERAVILCSPDGIIDAAHLPSWLQSSVAHAPALAPESSGPTGGATGDTVGATGGTTGATGATGGTLDETLAALEHRLIVEALEKARGNMGKAAKALGLTGRVMGLRMKKYGLDYRAFRP